MYLDTWFVTDHDCNRILGCDIIMYLDTCIVTDNDCNCILGCDR